MKFEVDANKFNEIAGLASSCVELSTLQIFPEGYKDDDLGIENGGLYFQQLDKANIISLSLKIPPSFFESYNVEQQYSIGMPWEKISSVLSRVRDPTVEIESGDKGKLDFEADSGFSFQMSLVSTEGIPSGGLPDLDYDTNFACTMDDIGRVVNSCELVDDSIHFEVKQTDDGNQEIVGWASGDTDSVEDRITKITGDDLENAHTIFGTDIINKISKNIPNDNSIQVGMSYNGGRGNGKNYPMRIQSELFNEVDVDISLAPRNKGT